VQIIPVVFLISNFRHVLNAVCFLLGNSPASEFYMPTFRNTLFHLHRRINTPTFSNQVVLHTYPPMKMEQCVPKRRHIKFRCWGITQKKAYNIPAALWTKWPILSSRSEVASVIQCVPFILPPTYRTKVWRYGDVSWHLPCSGTRSNSSFSERVSFPWINMQV